MIHRWDVKTKNSPFRVNMVEKEETRMANWENREYRKQLAEDKDRLIDSMIGNKKFDACSKDTVSKVFQNQQDVQLALALRKHVSDKGIVYRERTALDQMTDIEFCEMRHKFPNIEFNGIATLTSSKGSRPAGSGRGGGSDGYSGVSSANNSTAGGTRNRGGNAVSAGSALEEQSRRNSFGSRAETYDSRETGSGSVYRPPTFDTEAFDRELETDFPDS